MIKDNDYLAIDLNTEQLMSGVDSEGQRIEPEYTPFTQRIKREKGQPSDRVTLKDTGDFHGSIFMHTDAFPVLFDANDYKWGKLSRKYGSQVLGLTNSNKSEYLGEIKDKVLKSIRKLLL